MKKFLTAICAVMLIAVLAVTVSGCGKADRIKSAFKNAGYEICAVAAKDSDDLKTLLKTEEQKAEIDKYEVFTCKNDGRTATVVRFPSGQTMMEVLGESTYNSKSENGYINGECYFVSGCTDALYIFKNA